MNKFYKIMFSLVLSSSTLITISSYSWLMMWMGVEMNLMAILPIMLTKNNNYSSESSMKYFLVQAMASTLLIFSILMMEKFCFFEVQNFFLLTLQSSLVMKLGLAPFHFWLPEVMEGISWMNCLIILTWQKIAPMIMLMMTMKMTLLLMMSMILSSIIGGLMGMNQISIRKLLTYSSMNHMVWMLMSMMKLSWTWMIYFLIYSISNFFMIIYFHYHKIFFINQINLLNNKLTTFLILMNFLNLGGMPPLMGFMPKWMTIYYSMETFNLFMSLIIIITSLVHIFFYLRIMIPSIMFKNQENQFFMKKIKMNWLMFMNSLFLMSLPLSNLIF